MGSGLTTSARRAGGQVDLCGAVSGPVGAGQLPQRAERTMRLTAPRRTRAGHLAAGCTPPWRVAGHLHGGPEPAARVGGRGGAGHRGALPAAFYGVSLGIVREHGIVGRHEKSTYPRVGEYPLAPTRDDGPSEARAGLWGWIRQFFNARCTEEAKLMSDLGAKPCLPPAVLFANGGHCTRDLRPCDARVNSRRGTGAGFHCDGVPGDTWRPGAR